MREEELDRLKKLRREMPLIEETIKELRAQAERMTTMLDGLPRTNTMVSSLEASVVKLMSRAEELQRKQMEYYELKMALATELYALEPIEGRVMSMRYLQGKGYKEIATILRCSVTNVFRLHRLARKKIITSE